MFFLEQVANHVRLLLSTMQVASDVPDHFLFAGRTALAQRVGLHVLIQQLVRVQLGAVARQSDQTQAIGVFGGEFLTATDRWTGCPSTIR